jgi:hypothetical protein
MFSAVVVVALLAAQAGEGEGEGEGEDPCTPTCVDATTLSFCDTATPTTLDCATVARGARCGELSADWGVDCLLPAGAACDAGYGFGESRCDDGLSCIDGACAAGTPAPTSPPSPTPGTATTATTTTTASSCLGGSAAAVLLPAAALSRLRRRRRR